MRITTIVPIVPIVPIAAEVAVEVAIIVTGTAALNRFRERSPVGG